MHISHANSQFYILSESNSLNRFSAQVPQLPLGKKREQKNSSCKVNGDEL